MLGKGTFVVCAHTAKTDFITFYLQYLYYFTKARIKISFNFFIYFYFQYLTRTKTKVFNPRIEKIREVDQRGPRTRVLLEKDRRRVGISKKLACGLGICV